MQNLSERCDFYIYFNLKSSFLSLTRAWNIKIYTTKRPFENLTSHFNYELMLNIATKNQPLSRTGSLTFTFRATDYIYNRNMNYKIRMHMLHINIKFNTEKEVEIKTKQVLIIGTRSHFLKSYLEKPQHIICFPSFHWASMAIFVI